MGVAMEELAVDVNLLRPLMMVPVEIVNAVVPVTFTLPPLRKAIVPPLLRGGNGSAPTNARRER